MTVQRGDIWMANLNPTRGTVLTIPLTINLCRAALPACVRVEPGEGGLESASVLLIMYPKI